MTGEVNAQAHGAVNAGSAAAPRRRRVVVALGGNAAYPSTIRGTAEEQLALMRGLCAHLVAIIRAGWQLVLTHGNGPVVGNILYRMARTADELPPMPMDVCVAHSQGGLGYMLQQSFANVLQDEGLDLVVSAVVTEVEVDPADPAFTNPTKPVGRFFAEAEARRLAAATGWDFAEDAGRGWRRIVASPRPQRILDLKTIDALLDAGVIPIACGGGGVSVVRDADGRWRGVPAVIDKDLTSALLAAHLQADALVMLTGVERVALDFNRPTQRWLDRMSLAQARAWAAEGQFPAGSMGPKIDAAVSFLERLDGEARARCEVIITSIDLAYEALMGRAGTHVVHG